MNLTYSKTKKPKQPDLVTEPSGDTRVYCPAGQLVAKLAEVRALGYVVLSMRVQVQPAGYWLVLYMPTQTNPKLTYPARYE